MKEGIVPRSIKNDGKDERIFFSTEKDFLKVLEKD